MREVVISRWCEVCWQEDGTKTPAIGAIWLTLTLSEDAVLPPAKAIDICEPHGRPFADLATLHERAAGPVEGPPVERPPVATPARRGRPPKDPETYKRGTFECPVCSTVYTAKHVLLAHIWNVHRREERTPQPTVCPDCGKRIDAPASMGNHRAVMHDWDSLLDAVAGVPGWNRVKAERWRKGMATE